MLKNSKKTFFPNLIVIVLIIFFILSIIYIYFKSEIYYHGTLKHLHIYYYIFIGGLVFWLIVFFLKDETKIKIILISFSTILALYVIELFQWNFPSDPLLTKKIKIAKKLGIEYDKRSAVEVYHELKKTNSDISIYIFVGGKIIYANGFNLENGEKIFPLSGISNKNIITCNEFGKWLVYKSDRYGFHNPDEIWNEKSVDWIFIGDSFGEGKCVPSKKNTTGRIKSLTNEVAINLGKAGNGPLAQLAILQEYGKFTKPNKVIWMYYEGNDLHDLDNEKNSPILIKYLEPEFSQKLMDKQKLIDNVLNNYLNEKIKDRKKTNFIQFLRFHKVRKLTFESTQRTVEASVIQSDLFNLFSKIFLQAKETAENFDGNLYFVYLPGYYRYSQKIDDHGDLYNRNKILKIIKNLNIPIIDIHEEVFKQHSDPLSLYPFGLYGHYTEEGYNLIANTIIKKVYEFEK